MKKKETKPRKQTQYDKIYLYVREHGSISPQEAFKLGITKLATRISEMTRSGAYSVVKVPVVINGVRYMTYKNIKKRRIKNEGK